ncbi:transient receptor potential cation channel subfamily M member 4-like isoform X3 [Mya arenaria]|uniref:transient receptor potential cation channel subfamily M member 4-like isoform X3 n=1 Tax=Mya arenaria TaxID=6604 RepID=UPI0022E4CDBE|nr:transient receptor potential cation channel subfamily M member 4-like isoform X3 [Mya arenaria]
MFTRRDIGSKLRARREAVDRKERSPPPVLTQGRLQFKDHGGAVKWFCRVSDATQVEDVLREWGLGTGLTTSLLISVTGDSTSLPSDVTIRAGRGLIGVIRTTGAWVVADAHCGAMEVVGDTVRRVEASSDFRPIVIGVSDWSRIKDKLKTPSQHRNGIYTLESVYRGHVSASPDYQSYQSLKRAQSEDGKSIGDTVDPWDQLDTCFTHFLFLDVGKEKERQKVRASIDSCIATGRFGKSEETNVPVVLTVFGAQERSKAAIRLAAKNGHSVLVIDSQHDGQVLRTDDGKPCPVKVFSGGTAEVFAQTLMNAVISANVAVSECLRLAIVWKMPEHSILALLEKDRKWQDDEQTYRNKIFALALERDIEGTARLLLEHGVHVADFCTEFLHVLFQETCLKKNETVKDIRDVERLIYQRARVKLKLTVTDESGKAVVPGDQTAYLGLFVWALFAHMHEVATFFWGQLNNKMAAALLGHQCLQWLKHHSESEEGREVVRDLMAEYTARALKILDGCYGEKKGNAKKLLVRRRRELGGTSCILLAKNNLVFIQHPACQAVLNDIWIAPLAAENETNSTWRIVLSVFMPFLSGFLLVMNRECAGTRGDDEGASFCNTATNCCGCFRRFYRFFTSPIVKFTYTKLLYLVFLSLFAHGLITESKYVFIVVACWVATLLIEEVFQLCTKRLQYFYDTWNWFDLLAIFLFAIGTALKYNSRSREAGRIVLAVDFIVFSLRILQAFTGLRNIGPMIIMIKKMMIDLGYFLIILLVVVVSYAIATQSIMFPESEPSMDTAFRTLRQPYWSIFGELNLEEIEDDDSCSHNETEWRSGTVARCPDHVSKYAVPILLGVYMLIVQVLLLNLLIAMFSYTISVVQEEADKHWCYLRFKLIRRYHDRSFLVPPFIVLYHVYQVAFTVYRSIGRCAGCMEEEASDAFCKVFSTSEDERLQIWEQMQSEMDVEQPGDRASLQSLPRRQRRTEHDRRRLNEHTFTVYQDNHDRLRPMALRSNRGTEHDRRRLNILSEEISSC